MLDPAAACVWASVPTGATSGIECGLRGPSKFESSVRPVFERVRVIEIRRAASHGVVDVTHASGRQGRAAAERASGHPGSPLTDEARLAKV